MANSNKSLSRMPAIPEEDASLRGYKPLQRTPGNIFMSFNDDDDDGGDDTANSVPRMNTNSNRHEPNQNSDDSGGSDGENEKPKGMHGPHNIDNAEEKKAPLEDIPEADELTLKAPTWDTMLSQLNKLPGDAILLLADVRAVMLSQSHWDLPYPQALGHVLLAWQMLRSGCYQKDCRVWLRKRYKEKAFRQHPFTSVFGIAGFCIRRKRKCKDSDILDPEHRDERLKNNLIEYTGYSGMKGKKIVRRINSKKDERTERYKGTEWQELDTVVVRWDNSGYHTSGPVTIISMPEQDLDPSGTLRRHSSLPSHSQTPEETTQFTVDDCLRPGQKKLSPPNKRLKRHNSDSRLCPGKASQVWMDYTRRQSSELVAEKTSSEDLTKEELWNRAMAEVNGQNHTSSNNGVIQEKEEERAPSPAGSVASADWSVGSQQSSSSSCSRDNCTCTHCTRSPTTPGNFSPQQSDTESVPEVTEADEPSNLVRQARTHATLLDIQALDGDTMPASTDLTATACLGENGRSGNEAIVSKMKNSLTLSDLSNGECGEVSPVAELETIKDCEFVSLTSDHLMLQVEGEDSSSFDLGVGDQDVKCSKDGSSSSMGFQPSTQDILTSHHSIGQPDKQPE